MSFNAEIEELEPYASTFYGTYEVFIFTYAVLNEYNKYLGADKASK